MKKQDISGITAINKLEIILAEDVNFLTEMLENRPSKSNSYKLIESLKTAKQKILNLLPQNGQGTNQIPTTGSVHMAGRISKESADIKDNIKLVNILLDIENDQMDFVKNSISEKGISDYVNEKLNTVLVYYKRIVDQLKRSKSTNQLGIINID